MIMKDQPLYMPAGSVRSIIALAVVGSYIAGLVAEEVMFLVLGFYFGSRSAEQAQAVTLENLPDTH